MASKTTKVNKKPRKHVRAEKRDSEPLHWYDVPANQIKWIVTVSFELECLTSFSARRDHTALNIRVWHPDVDIEPIYFTLTKEGRVPDKVIDFFEEIAIAVDKSIPGGLNELWKG